MCRRECIALHYQEGNQPQKVLTPERRRIDHGTGRNARLSFAGKKRLLILAHEEPKAKRSISRDWPKGNFQSGARLNERYRMLQIWAKKGVLLVDPKIMDARWWLPSPSSASFTVDEAKRRPDKVRAAIQKTLDKAIQKAAEKPPTMPLRPRPAINTRRSISSGPHRLIHSKPVGQAHREELAVAKEIESPSP